ncbi:MAG: CDP-diacylglycerol--glycerol-3-phosphate 3-phosphatidyltransferase [Syntrophus sp. (in: bacteria)]|nr:CDP-diacylglycerol--glycerol-3-phosphate 3-phosphatidyltransferase [Syntrophus sp. (in: bacteria)]
MIAKDEKLQIWTLPNRLSIIRILFIPIIIFCMEKGFFFAAFFLFIIAGITDGLDGFIARKLNMTTKLGLYLDPIADKLLVSSVLITLTYFKLVPLWITIILVCREFLINGLRSFYAVEGIAVYPSFAGKLKTMLQIVGIAFILFDSGNDYLRNTPLDKVGLYILYGALFFSIFSAWNYIAAIFKPHTNSNKQ